MHVVTVIALLPLTKQTVGEGPIPPPPSPLLPVPNKPYGFCGR